MSVRLKYEPSSKPLHTHWRAGEQWRARSLGRVKGRRIRHREGQRGGKVSGKEKEKRQSERGTRIRQREGKEASDREREEKS